MPAPDRTPPIQTYPRASAFTNGLVGYYSDTETEKLLTDAIAAAAGGTLTQAQIDAIIAQVGDLTGYAQKGEENTFTEVQSVVITRSEAGVELDSTTRFASDEVLFSERAVAANGEGTESLALFSNGKVIFKNVAFDGERVNTNTFEWVGPDGYLSLISEDSNGVVNGIGLNASDGVIHFSSDNGDNRVVAFQDEIVAGGDLSLYAKLDDRTQTLAADFIELNTGLHLPARINGQGVAYGGLNLVGVINIVGGKNVYRPAVVTHGDADPLITQEDLATPGPVKALLDALSDARVNAATAGVGNMLKVEDYVFPATAGTWIADPTTPGAVVSWMAADKTVSIATVSTGIQMASPSARIPVTAGEPYTFSATVKSSTASGETYSLAITWHNSVGVALNVEMTTAAAVGTGAVTAVVTGVAPAGTVSARVLVRRNAGAVGARLHILTAGFWRGSGGLIAAPGQPIPSLGYRSHDGAMWVNNSWKIPTWQVARDGSDLSAEETIALVNEVHPVGGRAVFRRSDGAEMQDEGDETVQDETVQGETVQDEEWIITADHQSDPIVESPENTYTLNLPEGEYLITGRVRVKVVSYEGTLVSTKTTPAKGGWKDVEMKVKAGGKLVIRGSQGWTGSLSIVEVA